MVAHPVVEFLLHCEPVNPLTQTQLQPPLLPTMFVPPFSHVRLCWQLASAEALSLRSACCWRGTTINMTGTTTAAATRMISRSRSSKNIQRGIPQHLFRLGRASPRSLSEGNALCLKCDGQFVNPLDPLEPGGVAIAGGGKEARMSEIEPDRLFSEFDSDLLRSSSNQFIPNLLAVLPRSRLEASLVARRIKSGRLVRLPRASASLTTSTLSRGGRLEPTLCEKVVGSVGVWRLFESMSGSAPPFSSPPRIWSTRGSFGASGDRDRIYSGGAERSSLDFFSDSDLSDDDEESKAEACLKIPLLSVRVVKPAVDISECLALDMASAAGCFSPRGIVPNSLYWTGSESDALTCTMDEIAWFSERKLSPLLMVVNCGRDLLPRLAWRTSPESSVTCARWSSSSESSSGSSKGDSSSVKVARPSSR